MNSSFLLAQHVMLAAGLCTPRILAAFTVAPFFSAQFVTGVTRNCLAVSFALILFPTTFPAVGDRNLSMLLFLGIVAKEGIIGAVFGFMAGLFFWAIGAIGELVDRQRGTSIAESIDPAAGYMGSPMGAFLMQLAILLFFSTGGFLVFLSTLYESYQVWPILSYFPKPNADFARFFLERIDDYMEMVALLAAPMLIGMFLSDLGLGLINRFAPQLNVFFLSLPIKSALAVFILILYLPYLISYMKKILTENSNVLQVLKLVIQ